LNRERPTPSGPRANAKIDASVGNTALVQEIRLQAQVAGQHANASGKQGGHNEQTLLTDEPGPDRVGGEGRTGNRDIERRLSLSPPRQE